MSEPVPFYSRSKKEEAPRGKGRFFLQLLILILICWVVTVAVAPLMLRPEMESSHKEFARSFRDIEMSVRIPLPFVVSFRVRGVSEKAGVQAKHMKTRYFVWFFTYQREIPEAEAPAVMKWMWF
jgi:hypothetical protein